MIHGPEERVGRYLSLLAIPQSRLKAWRKLGRTMGVPRLRAAWRRGEIERTALVEAACAVLGEEFDELGLHADESKDPIMVALRKLEAL